MGRRVWAYRSAGVPPAGPDVRGLGGDHLVSNADRDQPDFEVTLVPRGPGFVLEFDDAGPRRCCCGPPWLDHDADLVGVSTLAIGVRRDDDEPVARLELDQLERGAPADGVHDDHYDD